LNVTMMTARETVDAVSSGKMSASEAVRTALDAATRGNAALGAFLTLDPDSALQSAGEVEHRLAAKASLPLAGLPIAVKDNICVRGMPATCASRMLANFRPPYDAHVVERLRSAGAVIIGKTNLDEFAMGSSNENSALAVTRNPWDHARVPGGSSGGSAAAVAGDLVTAALGSDTGGSVRQPAALCGVVGLKPTYGRVSRYGLIAFGSSLDQIGTLTRTAEDAALLLGVIAGHDARDSTSLDAPVGDGLAAIQRPLKGMRIGIAAEYFGEGLSDDTRTAVEAAIAELRAAGAEPVEVHLPHMRYGVACYYLIATAEASSNLARYDGVHYGHRSASTGDVIEMYAASREEGFGPEVKRRIMLGTYALSSGYYDAYYLRAMKVRTLLRRDFAEAFERCDVICSPVTPSPAFRIGEKIDDPLAMYLADIYTISVNLAGIPSVSVPCGFSREGLPIGMQLMGPALAEDRLLAVAHQYQQRTDHHLQRPD
jgi:aspartyl-tRNA(Asn)/glutamyl-tRNA(Gln) amidotransferase subunit A